MTVSIANTMKCDVKKRLFACRECCRAFEGNGAEQYQELHVCERKTNPLIVRKQTQHHERQHICQSAFGLLSQSFMSHHRYRVYKSQTTNGSTHLFQTPKRAIKMDKILVAVVPIVAAVAWAVLLLLFDWPVGLTM